MATELNQEPRTITVDEARKQLGISRGLAYRLAASGELAPGLPVFKLGNTYRISRKLLDAYLDGKLLNPNGGSPMS